MGMKGGNIHKHSDLISRQIAYKYIYSQNKNKYPLPFSKYVVHHIDHNKKNNDVSNLKIMLQEDHEILHGIKHLNPYNDDVLKSLDGIRMERIKRNINHFKDKHEKIEYMNIHDREKVIAISTIILFFFIPITIISAYILFTEKNDIAMLVFVISAMLVFWSIMRLLKKYK